MTSAEAAGRNSRLHPLIQPPNPTSHLKKKKRPLSFFLMHLWSPGFWDIFLASLICSEQLPKTPAGPLVATWYKPTLTVSPFNMSSMSGILWIDLCLYWGNVKKYLTYWTWEFIRNMNSSFSFTQKDHRLEKLLLQEILKNVGCIC